MKMNDERLVVVGTGICTVGQMTMESIAWIKKADRVLYITSDPIAEEMIKTLNPSGAESLQPFYAENKLRLKTYHEMIDRTLDCLRAGRNGVHGSLWASGVFAYPTHESVRRARAEGFNAHRGRSEQVARARSRRSRTAPRWSSPSPPICPIS
jgi:Tetrapyrrole (Corrin/Porphyrin) Methylases